MINKRVYFDKIVVNSNKAEFVSKLNNVVAFVDDNIENCESVENLNKNIFVYLCNTETNLKKATNLKRFKSFYELEKFMNKDLKRGC